MPPTPIPPLPIELARPTDTRGTRPRTPDLAGIAGPAREGIDAGVIPCAVIGISDGMRTLHLQALSGPSDRPSVDSRFFLASVTKPIVAAGVLQLVDESRLDLRAPLAVVLPELERESTRTISAWHVLTHTAGLADIPFDVLWRQRPSYSRMLERVLAETPEWEPGTRFRYCSDSFYLLAETIARLTGMTFADALRARVLGPLGMRDTTFDARTARARTMVVHGVPMRNRIVRELVLRFLAGAMLPGGGLFGTAEDLLQFGRAMLPRRDGGGPRILSGAAIKEMTREQTRGIPEVRDDGTVREPAYALGWRTPSEVNGMPGMPGGPGAIRVSPGTVTHGGASGTRLWVDPARDLVFVFLSNVWYGDDKPMYATLQRVYEAWDDVRTPIVQRA